MARSVPRTARQFRIQLLAIDLQISARTVLATTMVVGPVSGIEPAQPGAYFAGDLLSRRLVHVARDGKVTTLARFDHGGGGIAVSPIGKQLEQAGTLFVPFPDADAVSAFDLSPLIRAAMN